MSYAKLKKLVSDPAPAFRCASGDRQYVARILHRLRSPASATALARLEKLVPRGSQQLLAFYAQHDGCVLFKDRRSETAGIELFRISRMKSATASMYDWLDMLDEEEDTNRLKSAIAIGEVPQSGNYFAMPVEGRQTGKVFYVDHDDWRDEPLARSFNAFLGLLTQSPAQLLEDLGCYARYSDGKTETQWIPVEYLRDVAKSVT